MVKTMLFIQIQKLSVYLQEEKCECVYKCVGEGERDRDTEREAYCAIICSWNSWGNGIATPDYLRARAPTREVILQREIETSFSHFLFPFNLHIFFIYCYNHFGPHT